MKLWHVEFMIQDRYLHDTMLYLEGKAYNVKHHPVKNGSSEEEKPKKVSKRKAPNGGVHAMSLAQQDWIAKHVKGDMTHADLRDAWGKTNFRSQGLYGALKKAIRGKVIKKTAAGIYRPYGG